MLFRSINAITAVDVSDGKLTKSFLVIDPAQVTDVFAVTQADDGTELTDKIYGQIYFDCQVKLPISRVAIPRLD